jgi:microcompartment protein CcmK/EutM
MLLGKVVGTLVATRKEESLEGLKFLILRQLDIEGKDMGGYRVAADAVGAGLGVIMAIVDVLEVDGDVKYDKAEAG